MDNNAIKITVFDIDKRTASKSTLEEMKNASGTQKVYWCHCDTSQPEAWQSLVKALSLDENVVEYIKEDSSIPEYDEAEDSLTFKIQAPVNILSEKKRSTDYDCIIIHLTAHYCLTFADQPILAINEFTQQAEKSLRFAKTPGFIMFLILDNVLNDNASILLSLESHCDDLESNLPDMSKNHYQKVMAIKREAIKSKRYLSAIRDMLMRSSGRKINVISESCRKSLVDLYNHSQALISESDSIREILNGMLDQIDNAIMQKMSESMKILTAYATIFMPPTLIAGIYGMNFRNMPELNWQYGYYYALALIFFSGLTLFILFRRLK